MPVVKSEYGHAIADVSQLARSSTSPTGWERSTSYAIPLPSCATAGIADMPRERLLELMIGRKLTEVYPPPATQPGGVILDVSGIDEFSLQLRTGEVVGQIGSGAIETIRALAGLFRSTNV